MSPKRFRHCRSLREAYDLKHEWGVSMQALTSVPHNLRVITRAQRMSFCKRFNAMGWRTRNRSATNSHRRRPCFSIALAIH